MFSPFDVADDVSVLVQDYYTTTNIPELRTRIKVLENGNVMVTAPGGNIQPMFAAPGQELIIDMGMTTQVSTFVKYAIYRLTKKVGDAKLK